MTENSRKTIIKALKIVFIILFIAFLVFDVLCAYLSIGDATNCSGFNILLIVLFPVTAFSALICLILALYKKKFRVLSIILSLMLSVGLVPFVKLTDAVVSKPYRQFTPEKWSECDYCYRQYMIKDLEKQYNIVGMKKEDVQALLGEASECFGNDNENFYEIVKTNVFMNFYIITYDDNGVVISAETGEHEMLMTLD